MLQFVLSGVSIGAIYGLLGLALALSFFWAPRVINFAAGANAYDGDRRGGVALGSEDIVLGSALRSASSRPALSASCPTSSP